MVELRGPDLTGTEGIPSSRFMDRFARQALPRQHEIRPRHKIMPMSTIAWSHHMSGDARPSLEFPRVFLNEVNARMLEIPHLKIRGTRRHSNKFTVIPLRSR